MGYDAKKLNQAMFGAERVSRVVLVRPSAEFLGGKENYHFTRRYETHAETWHIAQYSGKTPSDVFKSWGNTFEARDGSWYVLFHSFHHSDAEADKDFHELQTGLAEIGEGLWLGIL